MARGFVYLCAVVDRFSRRVRAWRLSISMDVWASCIEAVLYAYDTVSDARASIGHLAFCNGRPYSSP